MTTLVIRSEEDAWALLSRLLDNPSDSFHAPVTFKGWPVLSVRLSPGDGCGNPQIVKALDRLQRHVYCAFAFLKYGHPDGRRLTRQERNSLALKHSITRGSTVLDVFGADALKEFARQAGKSFGGEVGKNIRPRHAVTMVLLVGLSFAAPSMWASWLNHKADVLRIEDSQRRVDAVMETQREFAGLIHKMSDQHAQQIAMVNAASHRSELARYAVSDFIPWRPPLLEIATTGTVLTISGLHIAAEPARAIAKIAVKTARAERKKIAAAKKPEIGPFHTTTIAEPVRTLPSPPMRLGRTAST